MRGSRFDSSPQAMYSGDVPGSQRRLYYFGWFDVGLDLVFYGFYVIFCSWLVNYDYNLLHDYLMELFIIIFTRDNFWLHRYDCSDMFVFPVNHDSSENTVVDLEIPLLRKLYSGDSDALLTSTTAGCSTASMTSSVSGS